jgi:hypothetical protein
VCCFGEDIDGEHSVEDNNDAYDGGKISIDKGGDEGIDDEEGAGGGEGIDDEEGIFEDDSDDDSEVLFDVQLDISSG